MILDSNLWKLNVCKKEEKNANFFEMLENVNTNMENLRFSQ